MFIPQTSSRPKGHFKLIDCFVARIDLTMATKKLRSERPDIVVAVGSGEAMQEFKCYSTVLCLASEYFDAMLSSSMQESMASKYSLAKQIL